MKAPLCSRTKGTMYLRVKFFGEKALEKTQKTGNTIIGVVLWNCHTHTRKVKNI